MTELWLFILAVVSIWTQGVSKSQSVVEVHPHRQKHICTRASSDDINTSEYINVIFKNVKVFIRSCYSPVCIWSYST